MKKAVFAALIIATFIHTARADNWPEFRGPTGQGISTAAGVPIRWSASEGIAWKQPIPGTGWSSPVLVDGRIYLTTAVEQGGEGAISLRALCVDATSGSILWDVEAIRPTADEAKVMHQKNSLASPTPVVVGDRVYVHFGHMGTAALDLAGNVLWRQTEIDYDPTHGNGGSPVVVNDFLIFSCDGAADPFLIALDRANGQPRWKVPRQEMKAQSFSFSTPLVIEVDGAPQLISPASGYVGAYDPTTGREIWRVTYGDGFSVIPRPVFAHGMLYICSGYTRANILAIDPAGARGDATADHVRWQSNRSVPFTPSVLVVGDELYFVSDNGVATCVDARTGDQHWTERLGGAFSASPVFAGGNIYFLSEEGVTSVVKAGKTYELVASNDLGERALASPAVDDGVIFLRTQSHLWRVKN
jgi:outer membrane protein assembly factor BamB